jgi:glycine hydroxymethyltransferase
MRDDTLYGNVEKQRNFMQTSIKIKTSKKKIDYKNIIFSILKKEQQRQEETINLIASENYTSKDVLFASGSTLTNKYAEGYSKKRYYSGCKHIDEIEEIATNLGKKLFNCEYFNVQPHSGSSANFAVYLSYLQPGDTVLGMDIAAGGHLTHGHKINFSGKIYNFVQYSLSKKTERLDYEEIEKLAQQYKPKMIVAGASAYSRIIDFKRFSEISKSVGACLFADIAHIAGLIATGLHPSPVGLANVISSTTHKTLRGPRGAFICGNKEIEEKINRSVMPGSQGGPLMHVIAAKAIGFAEALEDNFTTYQKQIIKNAQTMAQTFKEFGYRIISGGTDNHLFLVDLTSKFPPSSGITGKTVEELLEQCSITLNRNLIPFDIQSPLNPSGIRIGTPSITTRGFKEKEVIQITEWINEIIKNRNNDIFLTSIKEKIITLCKKHPIYK